MIDAVKHALGFWVLRAGGHRLILKNIHDKRTAGRAAQRLAANPQAVDLAQKIVARVAASDVALPVKLWHLAAGDTDAEAKTLWALVQAAAGGGA